MKRYIGIDIGGTKCSVILGSINDKNNTDSEHIEILTKIAFPTEVHKGSHYTLDKITSTIISILKSNNLVTTQIDAIGISCGGPLDSKRGIILSPPNLYGWDNIYIVKYMEDKFGISTKLQNDANACALAEWKYGAAKGFNNIIFLTCGTGFGAGLILGGRLYSGTSDMAGEIGHVRADNIGPVGYGKAGSFEGFCSGGGIAQIAKTKVLEKLQMGETVSFCNSTSELDQLNAKIIANAAEAGDNLAIEIYRISGQYLGMALSLLTDILNPEVIVIGSIFARSRDLLWPMAREIMDKETLIHTRSVCKVLPSSLGDSLGDIAALSVAGYKG